MQRNKTQRRRTPHTPCNDVVGPFGGDSVVRATESSLDALFAAEVSNTFQQAWQKLDRGGRLDRLRKYVGTYEPPTGAPLSPAERASLLTAVLQAFELRQLNSKLAVDYDPATATITAIRGLRERTNGASGLRTFRIEAAPATRTTQRQSRSAPKPTTPEHSNV
jgi:hypothetical protein